MKPSKFRFHTAGPRIPLKGRDVALRHTGKPMRGMRSDVYKFVASSDLPYFDVDATRPAKTSVRKPPRRIR